MNDNLIYDLYSYAFKHDLPLIVDAADEIKRLRKERDEARRLYCEEWAFTIELERGEASDPRDLANEKKWDCYKENTDYLQDLG